MASSSQSRPRTPARRVVRGLLHPGCGPLVRVVVEGPAGRRAGLAVIDTGASISAVDRELAAELGLPSPGVASWHAVQGDGERAMSALRRGRVQITELAAHWELDLVEIAGLRDQVRGYKVLALLGWDLLGSCRLRLDGPAGAFELELPGRG